MSNFIVGSLQPGESLFMHIAALEKMTVHSCPTTSLTARYARAA